MVLVNLLPWRAELRAFRQRQFFVLMSFCGATVILLLFFTHLYLGYIISSQETHNAYLQAEVSKLDQKIAEIRKLRKQREQLIARMNVIQNLQNDRPLVVHSFENFVDIIPSGVYLTEVKRDGDTVTLTGRAESNTRVSMLMNNISEVKWLMQPILLEIKNDQNSEDRNSNFILQLTVGAEPLTQETELTVAS